MQPVGFLPTGKLQHMGARLEALFFWYSTHLIQCRLIWRERNTFLPMCKTHITKWLTNTCGVSPQRNLWRSKEMPQCIVTRRNDVDLRLPVNKTKGPAPIPNPEVLVVQYTMLSTTHKFVTMPTESYDRDPRPPPAPRPRQTSMISTVASRSSSCATASNKKARQQDLASQSLTSQFFPRLPNESATVPTESYERDPRPPPAPPPRQTSMISSVADHLKFAEVTINPTKALRA
jgi:hypothetical protein